MHRLLQENINTVSNYSKMFREITDRDRFYDYSVVDKHRKVLERFKGGKLIDIGCLNSPLGIIAQKMFHSAEITLLDFSPSIVEFLEKNTPFEIVLSDCRNTPFSDNTFDYVVAEEVIEHMEEPEALIKEAHRILKPGGTFVLSTPEGEVDNECGGGYHIWSFKLEDIKEMLAKYGDAEAEIIPRERRKGYILGWLTKRS